MTKFLWVCFFLFSISVSSQKESTGTHINNKLLQDAIPIMEKLYSVKFSYIDAFINNKKISIYIDSKLSLENLIYDLQKQTDLYFDITGTNFITIRPLQKKDTISVCGHILDEEKKPIENIGVFFKANRTNTVTNEKGYFENTEILYNSVILISAPGFRQKVLNTKSFLNKKCDTIYLTHSKQEVLEEVFIQEYLAKGITQNKKIIHIDLNNVEVLPGRTEPDILQSIQLTPGVNNPFETASGIYVRGSAPNQNLVLWNGIKTYHQGHLFGMLSAFNPYVAKKVSFSKSGVSARYGDKIAGIIDIKSENKIVEKITGGAGFNMINADIVTSVPLLQDKISLQVSGRRSYTDVLETITYKQFSKRVFQNTKITETATLNNEENNFFYVDYNTNILLTPSDNSKIEVNSIYSKNDLDFKQRDTIASFNDNLITETEGYSVNWSQKFNNKFDTKISTYYTKYLLNYQFITKNKEILKEVESKKNSVKDFGAEFGIHYKLSKYHDISGGYQFSNNNIRYAFETSTPDYELILDQDDRFLNTHVGYIEYIFEKPNSFYVSAGIRANYYSELNQIITEPRLFAQKHITKNWKINASAEYRSQATSQIKESVISDLSLENQVWTLANNTVFPIIKSHQFTLGSSFSKKKWYLDIEGYYKQIEGITTLTAGFINPIDNTYHTGQSMIFGVDVFVKKNFKNYKTWISYSYINTKNRFEDINNNESFPGNWNIEHTIKWSQFYKLNNFQFSLGWIWHTGKAFTNISRVDESGEIIILEFDKINSDNLPVYHRLDFSAIYDFKIKNTSKIKYRIGASLLNLYNRKNVLNREYRTTNTLNNELINSDIFSLGITPNLSFRVFW